LGAEGDNVSLDDALKKLTARAAALNAASDELGTIIEQVEDRIRQTKANVSVWILPLFHVTLADYDGVTAQEGWQLGYAKVGQVWHIAARPAVDDGVQVQATGDEVRLTSTPRVVRIEALQRLEDLVVALAVRVDAFVEGVADAKAKLVPGKDGG
jgi:hypothetical protein